MFCGEEYYCVERGLRVTTIMKCAVAEMRLSKCLWETKFRPLIRIELRHSLVGLHLQYTPMTAVMARFIRFLDSGL